MTAPDYSTTEYLRHRTRQLTNAAIRRGELVRPKLCSLCNKTGRTRSPISAHHEDYDRPLDVVWLCTSCHHWRHRALRAVGLDPRDVHHRRHVDSVPPRDPVHAQCSGCGSTTHTAYSCDQRDAHLKREAAA